MIKTYATLGPRCCDSAILQQMLQLGLTGFRLNLSHRTLRDCRAWTDALKSAAQSVGVQPELIIDLRGSELRLGQLDTPISLQTGQAVTFGTGGIALDSDILTALQAGQTILLDDGIMELTVEHCSGDTAICRCMRGGTVHSCKSITLPGIQIARPALCEADLADLAVARDHGVTAVMQPFVRSRSELLQVHQALEKYGLADLAVFAKVEDRDGILSLPQWLDLCDVVTIARGDLGSSLSLYELPYAQKEISAVCRNAGKDFLVVTHLLQSMIHAPVPTRAEVTDIYNACLDGAAALMLTGETAQGDFGVEAVSVLLEMARRGENDRRQA